MLLTSYWGILILLLTLSCSKTESSALAHLEVVCGWVGGSMPRGCSQARRALHGRGALCAAARHGGHADAGGGRVAAAVEAGQGRGDLGELELSARSGVGRGA